MRVILINPPFHPSVSPPLGLGYISSVLKQDGHSVFIKDAFNLDWKEVRDFVRTNKADIYGIGFTTSNRFEGFRTAKIIREEQPDSKIIMGGVHPTFLPEQCLPYCDIVVRGEAEITFSELLKDDKIDLDVSGISFKDNGKIVHNPNREFIMDLDSIPFPDFEQFDLDGYDRYEDLILGLGDYARFRKAPMITTRGCPFQCIFCSTSKFWGHQWRFRTAKNIVDEIEWLVKQFDVEYIRFFDDNFTVSSRRVREICEEIVKRRLDIAWSCESRVDSVDLRTLINMKKAGCHLIEYGFESGSQQCLDVLNKKITIRDARRAVELTRKAGIAIKAYFIIGNPVEKKNTVKETRKFIEEIKPDVLTMSVLQVYPFTALFELSGLNQNVWKTETGSRPSHVYGTKESHVPLFTGRLSEKEALRIARRIHSNFYIKKYLKGIHNIAKHLFTDQKLFAYEIKDFGGSILNEIR